MLVNESYVKQNYDGVWRLGGGYYHWGWKYLLNFNQQTSKPATKENTSSKQPEGVTLPKAQTITKDKLINNLLDKKRLLTEESTDQDKWSTPWQAFNQEHKSKKPKAPWNFENWTLNDENATNLASFKKQCVELGKQKVSGKDDPVYIAVEKYCTTSTENA